MLRFYIVSGQNQETITLTQHVPSTTRLEPHLVSATQIPTSVDSIFASWTRQQGTKFHDGSVVTNVNTGGKYVLVFSTTGIDWLLNGDCVCGLLADFAATEHKTGFLPHSQYTTYDFVYFLLIF